MRNVYEIACTVTAEENGVLLFESDCFVELAYEVEDGEIDWEITRFRFQCRERSAFATPEVHAALLRHVDKDYLEEQLREALIASNVISRYAEDEHRAFYHAAVL